MAYETIKRNDLSDPDPTNPPKMSNHVSKYHSDDVQDFLIPLVRMHNSNLHDWGIARGLEVSGTRDHTEIVIDSGVAIDKNGQLISLSSTGRADIGDNPSGGKSNEVIVPVHIPTDNFAGKTVYVTIQFSELLRVNEGVLGQWEQVPWIRLQPVDAYDGESIVLAIAVLKEAGKLSELKTMDSTLSYCRLLIGESIEELRVQRSSKIGDQIQNALSGKIGPVETGGLKITVPESEDNILFAREDGGEFSNLEIRANVGIGTSAPSERLEVNGTVKAGKFLGDGSKLTGIKTGQWTDVTGGISYGGNVGIGISSPSEKLEVSGTIKAGKFLGDGSGLTGIKTGQWTDVTGGISYRGNVGIGTSSPSERLEVNGTVKAVMFLGDGSGLTGIKTGQWTDVTGGISYKAGNVGIGTISPQYKLHVEGIGLLGGSLANLDPNLDPHISLSPLQNSGGMLLIGWNRTGGRGETDFIANRGGGDTGGFNFYDYSNAGVLTNITTIQGNGNVGIGTASPSEKLTIQGDTSAPYALNVGGTSNAKIKVRHLDGKDYQSGNLDNLYLQYGVEHHTILNGGGSK